MLAAVAVVLAANVALAPAGPVLARSRPPVSPRGSSAWALSRGSCYRFVLSFLCFGTWLGFLPPPERGR